MSALVLKSTAPQAVGEYPALGQALSIGRHPDNRICLEDEKLSRFHCVIEPDGRGGWRARDLTSRNGTRVNGERIEVVPIQNGDILRVGSHEFAVTLAPGPAAAPELRSTDGKSRVGPGAKAGSSLLSAAWTGEIAEALSALSSAESADEAVRIVDSAGRASEALDGTGDGPLAVRLMLLLASRARATDVHLEPKGERSILRIRVDGQMVQICDLPSRVATLAAGLIKNACQMPPAAREAVQEGHFSSTFPDRSVDYRISFTPSVHGQKLVIRVLDSRGMPSGLDDLGLTPYMYERLRRTCQQEHGLLLVCGPTGSGKTTTLHNALRTIDRQTRNVVTIEDPVEYQLDHVTQVPIDEGKGNTFNALLRSVLRQDPDVIMLGEIRDEETARTAMQAAMTGHLVFSTVHAKDTISAVFRLLDLKVEPYLVANALDLVLAQRLVRLLCDHCKQSVPVMPGQATRVGRFLSGRTKVFVPVGCGRCLRTGYRGRRAIFELLDVNDDFRDVVLKDPTIAGMKRVIEAGLFTTLAQSGWRLVAEGVSSFEEVDQITGGY